MRVAGEEKVEYLKVSKWNVVVVCSVQILTDDNSFVIV